MDSRAFDRAKEMWAQAQWEPDEGKKKELAHTMIAAFDAMLSDAAAADMTKVQRAGLHNLRGLSYAMLGDDPEHVDLARRDYRRALKLNSSLGQARQNLQAANAALRTQDLAAKNEKARQRRLKYCCGCVPRCKKGPWKPKQQSVRPAPPPFPPPSPQLAEALCFFWSRVRLKHP
jgi:hypothetical protein